MFTTNPTFEDRTAAALFGKDASRFWQLMLLTNETPWFLVSYILGEGKDEMLQSATVAWETSLLALIEEVGPSKVISLRYIKPTFAHPGDWVMNSVAEVWLPSEDEAETVGPLLFRFFERPGLYDSFGSRANESNMSRHQLLKLQW